MTKYKINNNVAISHLDNREFLQHMFNKGVIGLGFAGDDMGYRTSNSAPMISTPNINVPLGALNFIKPEAIEVRTAIQTADKIAPKTKIGKWGDKLITIKIKEFMGKVKPDDGTANDTIKSTTNYSFVTTGVFPFCGFWGNNDLARETVGGFQENLQADDNKSLMNTMAIAQNNIFFNGVSEKNLASLGIQQPVYGLKNNPNLSDYTTVASNAGKTSTYWNDKTPQEIYNDVLASYTRLVNKSGGNIVENGIINGKGKLKLCIALGAYTTLMKLTAVGNIFMTAKQFLEANFKGLEIIPVPQFNSANSNSDVAYLIYEEASSFGDTLIQPYQELIRAYPVFQKHSELSQKISSCVSGCIVQIPMFIDRFDGIGQSTAFSQEIY